MPFHAHFLAGLFGELLLLRLERIYKLENLYILCPRSSFDKWFVIQSLAIFHQTQVSIFMVSNDVFLLQIILWVSKLRKICSS